MGVSLDSFVSSSGVGGFTVAGAVPFVVSSFGSISTRNIKKINYLVPFQRIN